MSGERPGVRRARKRTEQRQAVARARVDAEADRDRLAGWIDRYAAGWTVDRTIPGKWALRPERTTPP